MEASCSLPSSANELPASSSLASLVGPEAVGNFDFPYSAMSGRGENRVARHGPYCFKVLIPERLVPPILGKGGTHVKRIQDQF